MLIDVHSHPILPSWRAALAARSGGDILMKDGMRLPNWTPDTALEVMDANGIDMMILSAPSNAQIAGRDGAAALARRMNLEMAEIVRAHPRRFGAFAVLPLFDAAEAIAEARFALDELGFDGVGLLTSADGVYPGDARFEPLLAELNARRATAFVNPDTPAFYATAGLPISSSVLEFMFDSARAITSMLYSGMRRRYPDFTYIATHAGGVVPFLTQRLAMAVRVMPSGYGQEISSQDVTDGLRSFHYDVTASTSRVALTGLLDMVGTDRLLAGFDFPYMPSGTIAPARAALDTSPLLTARDRDLLYSENALALLPTVAARLEPARSFA